MTRDQIAVQLDRETGTLYAEARDNGHDPHPWAPGDVGIQRHTACRNCGWTMVVRLYPDGSVWKSGLTKPCEAKAKTAA